MFFFVIQTITNNLNITTMKEIREEVREFILNEVLVSLARIGVDCDLIIARTFEDKYADALLYMIESTPILSKS